MRELLSLQDRMNRLIDQTLSGARSEPGLPGGSTWAPTMDLYETDKSFVLKAELPGVAQDDIELRVDTDRITLRGERRLQEGLSENQFHRMERSFGPYTRSFALPATVDPDEVKAELKRGILIVTMPKRADERSKQIPISG